MIILNLILILLIQHYEGAIININGKTSDQSGTWGDHFASLAHDGDLTTYSIACSNCDAQSSTNAFDKKLGWWQIDLQFQYTINSLYVAASPDYSNSEYLGDFTIYISDLNSTDPFARMQVCYNFTNRPHINPFENQFLTCNQPIIGRFVTLKRNYNAYRPEAISIAEIRIDADLFDAATTPTRTMGSSSTGTAQSFATSTRTMGSSSTISAQSFASSTRTMGSSSTITAQSSATSTRTMAPSSAFAALFFATSRKQNPENIFFSSILDLSSMTASQAGTFDKFDAKLAIDNNPGTFSIACTGVCNGNEPSNELAWWQIDLKRSYVVTSVQLTSSSDETNAKYLQNFSIFVSSANSTNFEGNSSLCYTYISFSFSASSTQTFSCPQYLSGRFVTIKRNPNGFRTDAISLADVKIIGYPDPIEKLQYDNLGLASMNDQIKSSPIVLSNLATTQSGTFGSHTSNLAIDGKTQTWNIACTSCDPTYDSSKESNAWWAIDLNGEYLVEEVDVVSANDYYNAHYLSNFKVYGGGASNQKLCFSYSNESFSEPGAMIKLVCQPPVLTRNIVIMRTGGFRSDAIALADVVIIGKRMSEKPIGNEQISNNSISLIDYPDYPIKPKFIPDQISTEISSTNTVSSHSIISNEFIQNPTISILGSESIPPSTTTTYSPNNNDVIISLQLGKVRGVAKREEYSLPIVTFYDIPYAMPPVGTLRFEPTKPLEPWEGTHGSLNPRISCVQFDGSTTNGSEDCLTLNIYAPALMNNAPVMVFIHGEDYVSGSSNNFAGDVLAASGVVVVVPNYRLGLLGFLRTSDFRIKGNMALFDIIEVLKFVKDNIAAFGGSPDDVTLFGSGSGATMASLLAQFPPSSNLFQKLITFGIKEKANWLSNLVETNIATDTMFSKIINDIGCYSNEDQVACLKMADINKLQEITFANCNKNVVCELNARQSQNANVETVGETISKPLLSGFCKNQGIDLATNLEYVTAYNFNDVIHKFYSQNNWISEPLSEATTKDIVEAIKFLYISRANSQKADVYNQAVVDLLTDSEYGSPWDKQLTSNSPNEYNFGFVVDSETSKCDFQNLFGPSQTIPGVSRKLIRFITNFIKYSNPTQDSDILSNEKVNWMKFSKSDNSVAIISEYSVSQMSFYRSIFFDYHQVYQNYLLSRKN